MLSPQIVLNFALANNPREEGGHSERYRICIVDCLRMNRLSARTNQCVYNITENSRPLEIEVLLIAESISDFIERR